MANHKTVSIADQIFEQLEQEILSGKYVKGDVISELKLSEELGVSRTPIREAISRLLMERLLKEGVRGLEVVGVSMEDVMDMYEVRARLEGMAAGMAAKNISPQMLAAIQETLEMQHFFIGKQATGGGDRSEKIRDLDSRFHELLYEASDSHVLIDVLQPIHKKITKFRKASMRRTNSAEESWQEHHAIYTALVSGNAEEAELAAVEHIRKAKNRIAEIKDEE
ncbi:MAG: GntR family transcriptional regulator [Lachnospiraceae bacterium]|nr:GntR family transcriptional regulator [Lachnospiraceae bacterium]